MKMGREAWIFWQSWWSICGTSNALVTYLWRRKKNHSAVFLIFALDCSTLRPPHFTQPDFIADLKANIWNSKLGLVICSKLWHFAESSHSWIQIFRLFEVGHQDQSPSSNKRTDKLTKFPANICYWIRLFWEKR